MAKPLYDFNLVFNQKWNFFAPPPKSNSKLYFIYYDKKSPIYSFEVLSTILKEKQRKSPFNSKEEAVDYIISGSLSQLTSSIIVLREDLLYKNQNKTIEQLDKDAKELLLKKTTEIDEFNTLVKFSKVVAKKKIPISISNRIKNIKIVITETDIPKFHDRYTKKGQEKILLETNLINYENF